MSRRLAPALLSTLALLALPAAAAAQAPPPDERAAARAFADITLPAAHEIATAESGLFADVPTCRADRRLSKGTRRQQQRMLELVGMQEISALTRRAMPTLDRTVTALDAVQTADPILQKGRAAWHGVRRMYSRFAAFPRQRICSVMRDYVRRDYKPTRAMRRAARLLRSANSWDTTEIDQAMARAEKRLVKLGVPAAEADAFDGEIEREESGGGGRNGSAARAAQAPAPSSPLTSLRAAR